MSKATLVSANAMCARCSTFEVGGCGCLAIGPALRSIRDDAFDDAKQAERAWASSARIGGPRRSSSQGKSTLVVLIGRRCVTYCRPFIELFQATPSTHRASVQNICTHNTLPYCYLASRLPAHALLVICTSCLIVASSATTVSTHFPSCSPFREYIKIRSMRV